MKGDRKAEEEEGERGEREKGEGVVKGEKV